MMRTQLHTQARTGRAPGHRPIVAILSVAIVASLVLSCSLVTKIPELSPAASASSLEVTPEELARAEEAMVTTLLRPMAEAMGDAGEAWLAHYLAERRTLLAEVMRASAISARTSRPDGLARRSSRPQAQNVTVGAFTVVIFGALDTAARAGKEPEDFEDTQKMGSLQSTTRFRYTRSGSRIIADGEMIISGQTDDGSPFAETGKVKGVFDACPDSGGNVPLDLTIQWEVKGPASGISVSAQSSITGTVTAHVNDEAQHAGVDVDLKTGSAYQTPGPRAGQVTGAYAEVHTTERLDWSGSGNSTFRREVTRTSSQAGKTAIDNAIGFYDFAGMAWKAFLGYAEKLWQDGFCVEIIVEGVQDSNQVEPSSTSSFTARVRHKFEGTELKGPLTATLSGDQSVDPTEKTEAPASYTYVAGQKPEATATVNLETRSKRGVAKKSIDFTMGDTNWRPVSDVAPWSGQVCALDEPFTLKLGGIIPETYSLQPESESRGSFSMTQAVQNCEVRGTGTYTIEITVPEDPSETEADITLSVNDMAMYCPKVNPIKLPPTVLHILLVPYDDPACE